MADTCGVCTPGLCPHLGAAAAPAQPMVTISRARLAELEETERQFTEVRRGLRNLYARATGETSSGKRGPRS